MLKLAAWLIFVLGVSSFAAEPEASKPIEPPLRVECRSDQRSADGDRLLMMVLRERAASFVGKLQFPGHSIERDCCSCESPPRPIIRVNKLDASTGSALQK